MNAKNPKEEEEKSKMSDNYAMMDELYASTLKDIKEGEIVKGTIVAVNNKEVVVDIGFKSEGFVPVEEFRGRDDVSIGQQIEVLIEVIEDDNGRLVLSFERAEKLKGWQKISDEINEGDLVEGKIVRVVKGGYIVDVYGVEAFLPMSLSAFKGLSNHEIMAQKYRFLVAKMNKQRRNLILSRREMVQKEREEVREKLWGLLVKGERRRGAVKGITDFGAFIDLGGVDGLLHITDMSWSRINHPSEIVSIGDKIEVMILDFDKENSKVSLGLKQIVSNPWEAVYDKFPTGSKVKGKVVNIMPYGAFVELEAGLEGMIHVSDMSWTKKVNHPQEVVAKGQEVQVVVLAVDGDNRKITLGLKQLLGNPWSEIAEKYPVGTEVDSEVVMNSNFGVFVKLEQDIEALVYSSEIDKQQAAALKAGDQLKVRVIKVDVEQMKIGVSARL